MRIYDISQEVFGCAVYPGDPKPEQKKLLQMKKGDVCNLTAFSMCAHNGTHVDAPNHFCADGKTIDQMSLDAYIGYAYVYTHIGKVSAEDAEQILHTATAVDERASRRILIRGAATVTEAAASVFAEAGIILLGNKSQTVGPEDAPKETHLRLLGRGITLLEGIHLKEVTDGVYLLNAAPLNLGGCEGAPCRAVLIHDK